MIFENLQMGRRIEKVGNHCSKCTKSSGDASRPRDHTVMISYDQEIVY